MTTDDSPAPGPTLRLMQYRSFREPRLALLGLPAAALASAATQSTIDLISPPGGDRLGVLAAIRGRQSGKAPVVLLSADRDHGRELEEAMSEPAGPGRRLVFIDDFHLLGNQAPAEARRLAALARERACTIVLGRTETRSVPLPVLEVDLRLRIAKLDGDAARIEALVLDLISGRKPKVRISAPALAMLAGHGWRGDVAELTATIERIVDEKSDGEIGEADVAREIGDGPVPAGAERTLAEIEREQILRVLDRNGWNRTRSAKLLGIDVKTLYNKLKRFEEGRAPSEG